MAVLEQPYLFPICRPNFKTLMVTLAFKRYESAENFVSAAVPRVDFTFKNYGRTPAILRCVNATIELGPEAPSEKATYPLVALPAEHVVLPGELTSEMHAGMSAFKVHINIDEYNAVTKGEMFLWFVGRVLFEDLRGTRSDLHFCWKYDHKLHTFGPFPTERNEVTRRPKRLETSTG